MKQVPKGTLPRITRKNYQQFLQDPNPERCQKACEMKIKAEEYEARQYQRSVDREFISALLGD